MNSVLYSGLIAFYLIFIFISPNVFSGTMGIENRDLMTTDEKQVPEYRRVGVFTSNKAAKIGTGTVMGKSCDKVLVSAHSERSEDDYYDKYNNYGFYPDPKNLKNYITAYPLKTGWEKIDNHRKIAYDYAIFQLDRPAFSKDDCKQLGKIHIKTWDSNRPQMSSCKGRMSKVAINAEEMRNKRIVREFHARAPRSWGREVVTYQNDADSSPSNSGSPDWCHESGIIKLVGIVSQGRGSNPDNYKIKPGEDPGLGSYDANKRYTVSVSMWKYIVNDLIKYVGRDAFIIEDDRTKSLPQSITISRTSNTKLQINNVTLEINIIDNTQLSIKVDSIDGIEVNENTSTGYTSINTSLTTK